MLTSTSSGRFEKQRVGTKRTDWKQKGGLVPILPEKSTLQQVQNYVRALENERGFADQTVIHKCLLLGEEVGELFKAVRKEQKLSIDQNSSFGLVSEELADILIYLCAIANRCGVDLEQAFRDKEAINKTRVWTIPDARKTGAVYEQEL